MRKKDGHVSVERALRTALSRLGFIPARFVTDDGPGFKKGSLMDLSAPETIQVSFDPLDLSSARVAGDAASRCAVHINKTLALKDVPVGKVRRLMMVRFVGPKGNEVA